MARYPCSWRGSCRGGGVVPGRRVNRVRCHTDGNPQVLANAGAAANYVLDHLQYEHLDQPLLGFGPAVANPTEWLTQHFLPVVVTAVELAAGNSPSTASH
jgi:hypothetical protein